MRACAGPVTFSLRDVTKADIPTTVPHWEDQVLRACKLCQDVQIFADAMLRVNPMVARSISFPLIFPTSLLPRCRSLHPHWHGCHPFASLCPLLKTPKLFQSARLRFFDGSYIARVKEHMHMFMDQIHQIRPKERIPRKTLSYCLSKQSM